MKKAVTIILLSLLCFGAGAQSIEKCLLGGWKFHRGQVAGAESPAFDDSSWDSVTIPHDWAIAGPFDKEIDKQTVAIEQNGELVPTEKTGRSGSLPWIGEAWYRLKLAIPEGYPHAELVFDGAMSEPQVYVDGREIGYWGYGYTTFNLDASEPLSPGEHTLAVHLHNREESSRWYPGAGLTRPVRLILSQEARFETWGIHVWTKRADCLTAELGISSRISDRGLSGAFEVRHSLIDPHGNTVAMATKASSDQSEIVLQVQDPLLWSPETPALYTLVSEVVDGTAVLDRRETKTGIRTISFDSGRFRLNGEVRKIKGVCLHHDLGPLGAAFNKSAFRRQVALLKWIGCDAIRTAHNSPAPWQLDICDEMGMMVMAESVDMWRYPKCKNGYCRFFDEWWQKDFRNLVTVNRNHPSIIMWSIGNEIPEQAGPAGKELSVTIQDFVHELDPTRPCTQGMDKVPGAISSGTFQSMDVPGCNYRLQYYRDAHAAAPKGFILGSETSSTVSSRGVYKFPAVENNNHIHEDCQLSSYDLQACVWSNLPDDDWVWQDLAPWVTGEFVWSGFDYLGEPTPYDEYWPARSSYFGIFDLAGLPKDRAYLYRSRWLPEEETLHLLPHWTWPGREGEVTPVFCYTTDPEAELFVNGRSQGRRKRISISLEEYESTLLDSATPWGEKIKIMDPGTPDSLNRLNRYRLRWMDVVYEPGELKVVAYDADGNIAAEKTVRTAGTPHHIELIPDRKSLTCVPTDNEGRPLDCPEMAFVTARVVDRDGNPCPDADNRIRFRIRGRSARVNSCCNGDPTSLEPFTGSSMKAFHGEMVVLVEAGATPGKSRLVARSKGLRPAKVSFVSSPTRAAGQ